MIHSTRRSLLLSGLGLGACAALPPGPAPVPAPAEPFEASWDSLIGNYSAPEWFRDAKFGIWAHWSAQCVPEQGDWYARRMYMQSDEVYDHHLRTYGHPSETGFIDIYPLWKAESWDPEALIRRYKAAGAKYFVALANHHDNFDHYNSRHHPWNSVNYGPKRDIIGTWEKIVRAHGLRFGVSNHSGHSWHWYQPAYGYDAEGPKAGIRYDAYGLTRADGKGKWWEGLDPQQLYNGPFMVAPDGIQTIADMDTWHAEHDGQWLEHGPDDGGAYVARWKARCLDLIDSYKPDLVYFDNYDMPFGQDGLDVAAHFYNANRDWNGGRLEGVINIKKPPPERTGAIVEDVERGLKSEASPSPWQTDTCIGDWHYNRARFTGKSYKSVQWVVHALCDIVSKNGNLLLSIPVRGDGSIDSEEEAFLDGLTAWMAKNEEAIFATRPWVAYGEGPAQTEEGHFKEQSNVFTAADIRFTQKAGALYAIVLGWPDGGKVRIESLRTGSPLAPGSISRVQLTGGRGDVSYTRDAEALHVTLPEHFAGDDAYALRIDGLLPA